MGSKKLWIWLLIFLLLPILAYAAPRVKYSGIARDKYGNALSGATVNVYLTATTTPVTVYTTETGVTGATSVTTSSLGVYTFWVDLATYKYTQKYRIKVTKSGYTYSQFDDEFIPVFPADASGCLTSDGSGVYTWGTCGAGSAPSDTAYAASWDNVTTIAPSKNAVYDKVEAVLAAVQPINSNLTTFGALSCTTNQIPKIAGGVWTCAADASAAGASATAKYVTVQTEGDLDNEVNLGALTTGLLKITVGVGVATPSTAVALTDYLSVPTHTGGNCLIGYNATGADGTFGCYASLSLSDNVTFYDAGATSKLWRFDAGSIGVGTAVFTVPDATTKLVGNDTTDTLTNKTIAMASNALTGVPWDLSASFITPTSGDAVFIKLPTRVITIASIGCIVDPADSAESVVANIAECDANGDSCSSILDGAITCANTPTAGTITDTTHATTSNTFLKITLGTVTGTVSALTFYGAGTQPW